MKKRFTLMMMVLCFLMSIPLKMMAESVTIHFVDEEGWGDYAAYVYDTTKPDNGSNLVTGQWPGQKVTNNEDIKTLANGHKVVTWTIDLKTFELSNLVVIFNNNNNNKQYPASGGWKVTDGLYYYKNGTTSTTPPSGSETGGGSTDPTEKWDTETVNRLKGRVYSQGFYLAGNFFSFQPKEDDNQDNLITYDDAVFKFQQQKYDDEDYDLYKVDIPASLTARAQVMSVNEFGKPVMVYGPNSKFGISYTCPNTGETTLQLELKGSDKFVDGGNYWDMVSRNHSSTEYSDGMYEVYITVNKKTGVPAKWWFKHIATKRVAFFISDAKNATAMPVYDTYKTNVKQFSDKFFASVNLSAEHSYYVISNYVMKKEFVDKTNSNFIEKLSSQYRACSPNSNAVNCPTTNKLFLLGNGGHSIEDPDGQDKFNRFSPNEEPMKPSSNELGSLIIEYNPSNGTDDGAKQHLGICGRVLIRDTRAKLTSVSMVGDAIPGTVKDGVWDYKSTAADMTYDETEKCYKVTLVTTAKDGAAKFRFVGNHTKEINWHEDSTTDPKMKAKTPLDGNGEGHEATSYDPNKVNYTEKGSEVNPGKDWDIIWNRPAGRWTVRLYFYTYNKDNGNGDNIPVTDYYYTISANTKLELRDFENVVYKSLDNKRIIHNRGGYKYFRTWSAVKAWKISKDVDIFVVDGMTVGTDGKAKFTLKKVNADPTKTYNVIPSETGVILATKKTAADIDGHAEEHERASLTSYNTMVIPMEEYNPNAETTSTDYVGTKYTGTNLLNTLITAQVVPTKEVKEGVTYYNYLFGFYNAKKGLGVTTGYEDNEFLMGFWISKGTGAFYNNSAYLPIAETDVNKMGCLGVSHNDYTSNGAKKVPALFFDFANADGTTGIDEVVNTTVKNHDGKYYTLSGQQVEKPTTSGVYIHNGKKFVVK